MLNAQTAVFFLVIIQPAHGSFVLKFRTKLNKNMSYTESVY